MLSSDLGVGWVEIGRDNGRSPFSPSAEHSSVGARHAVPLPRISIRGSDLLAAVWDRSLAFAALFSGLRGLRVTHVSRCCATSLDRLLTRAARRG